VRGASYYLIRRVVMTILMLIGVTLITFLIIRLVPSDPARLWAGKRATLEQIAQARQELGLDKPWHIQYFMYLNNLLHGDLGISCYTRRPVISDLKDYFPATFELTTVAMIIALILGLILGIISATRKDTIIDHFLRVFSLAGVSMPSFWLGLLLQFIFGSILHLLPVNGRVDPYIFMYSPIRPITNLYLLDSLLTGNITAFVNALQHIILPAITLSYVSLAIITRIVRSSLLDVLKQDYIRTARSKGLSERVVIYKHALRNALIPTTTVTGLTYGFLLGGSVLIESVFDWPGLGLYATQSALIIDYPAIMGVTLLYATIYAIVNFAVDISYGLLDPRIRLGR
jgi:peptide/nickel transport system permease protein